MPAPVAELHFYLSHHDSRITVLDQLQIKSGWLELNLRQLDSFQREEHLVFTALTDAGDQLGHEACSGFAGDWCDIGEKQPEVLAAECSRQRKLY